MIRYDTQRFRCDTILYLILIFGIISTNTNPYLWGTYRKPSIWTISKSVYSQEFDTISTTERGRTLSYLKFVWPFNFYINLSKYVLIVPYTLFSKVNLLQITRRLRDVRLIGPWGVLIITPVLKVCAYPLQLLTNKEPHAIWWRM